MNGAVLLAATAAAVAAFVLAGVVVRPPARLLPRLAPYTDRVRQRLDTAVAHTTSASTSLWGPLVSAAARALGNIADAGRDDDVTLRLRHAGMSHLSADQYRRRQLGYTVAGATAGLVLAAALRLSAAAFLVVLLGCAFVGMTRWRATVDRRTEQRRTIMQAEAHMVAQLLAIYLRTGDTPMGAVERLTNRAEGIVLDELAAAIALIRSGSPASEVFNQLAGVTAEPSAARFYRLYGATWQASGDPAALLSLAEVLRAGRREDLARRMARRNTAMVMPLVVIIGPIMILFIAAAIPSIVLGR